MRWLLVLLALTAPVLAGRKATIAIAPLKGDSGDVIGKALVDALAGKDFKVTDLHDTQAAITKLKIKGDPEGKSLTKLEAELEVDILVTGKVTGTGKKRTVHLRLAKGKELSTVNLPFKSVTDSWSKEAHDQIVASVGGGADDPPEEEKPKKHEEEEKPKKHEEEEKPKKHEEEEKPKKHEVAAVDPAEDEEASVRKKHHRKEDAGARRRGGGDLQLDAGAGFAQRHMSYSLSGQDNVPPTVGTGAASLHVSGEVFPLAMSGSVGTLANLGLAATFDKTVGLSITVPNTTNSASINQAHFAIGARYRMSVGEQSTLVIGLDYAQRFFIADRSNLQSPMQLDAPDVNYKSVEPSASLRVPFTPDIIGFFNLGIPLIFSAGGIQSVQSYGPATVYGGELSAGGTYAVTKTLAVKVMAELDLINLSFKGTGEQASAREVTGALDRTIGLTATLAYFY